MKLYFSKIFVLFMVLFYLSTPPVWGNAGPTYWQGYPSWEVLVVDENCPVEVAEEKLLFDFSPGSKGDHTVRGQVTASYQMVNPTENQLTVQMAFPFVSSLTSFSSDSVDITVDGQPVPFDLYLGSPIDRQGYSSQPDDAGLVFGNILDSLTEKSYQAENFATDEKGTLYTIKVKPTTEEQVNFAIEFTIDQDKTKVLVNEFNRYERREDSVRIARWCRQPEVLEILVLGEIPDFGMGGYIDGDLTEETDLFTYEVITEKVELKSYVLKKARERLQPWPEELTEQLYNLYAQALDSQFANMQGVCDIQQFLGENRRERVMVLVYRVDFPANAGKKVSVSYQGVGTMDRRETRQPVYSFQYLLNPARHWDSFGNLDIEVITPEEAPYIIDSSIPLTREGGRHYSAKLDSLPEGDFLFSMYHEEEIDRLEPVYLWLDELLSFALFFKPLIIQTTIIAALGVLINSLTKRWKEQ